MILPNYVNLDSASTALRASARLIIHTGFTTLDICNSLRILAVGRYPGHLEKTKHSFLTLIVVSTDFHGCG